MRWWAKLIAALLVLALLLWAGWSMVNGMVQLLGSAQMDASEPDPMFAQEMEIPTRPPELDMEALPPDRPTLDDYRMPEGAPVDKTADQLIQEAIGKGNS